MASVTAQHFSTVRVHVSGVLSADADTTWDVVKDFGAICQWVPTLEVSGKAQIVRSGMLTGGRGTVVGAARVVHIGQDTIVEELTAMDNVEHTMRWRVISHPSCTNPFPASYLNSSVKLTLTAITISKQCLAELEASFLTEPSQTGLMHAQQVRVLEGMLVGLEQYLAANQQPHYAALQPPPHNPQSQLVINTLDSGGSSA